MILTDNLAAGGTLTTSSHDPQSSALPIVVAGGGCVGLFLALLLAHTPITNSIIVIESERPDPTSTRAMAHQPLTYPILSRVPDLLPELIQAGSLSTGLCFRTSVKNRSEVIAGKKFDNTSEGMKGKGQLLLPQGKFQEVLMRRLGEFEKGRVDVRIGQRVESFTAHADSVTVHVVQASGEASGVEEIEATYLIGADGAHSTIRKHLNVAFEGETLDSQLVATDLFFDFHKYGWYDANFILDPEDFGLVGRISPLPAKKCPASSSYSESSPPPSSSSFEHGNRPFPDVPLWRVSFSLPSSVSLEQIHATMPDKLSRMLPDHGLRPDNTPAYTISRIAPYTPHQRLASTLYTSRVCLIGDAAHLTNPYAGLGLASGIADASSLATVLSRILTRQAADSGALLSSWSDARREVFRKVVDMPSRMAYRRVQSDVGTVEKVDELCARDPLVKALKSGMPVKPGDLETRGEALKGW